MERSSSTTRIRINSFLFGVGPIGDDQDDSPLTKKGGGIAPSHTEIGSRRLEHYTERDRDVLDRTVVSLDLGVLRFDEGVEPAQRQVQTAANGPAKLAFRVAKQSGDTGPYSVPTCATEQIRGDRRRRDLVDEIPGDVCKVDVTVESLLEPEAAVAAVNANTERDHRGIESNMP